MICKGKNKGCIMKEIVKDLDYFSNITDLIFEKYIPEKMKIIDLKETFVDFKFNNNSKNSTDLIDCNICVKIKHSKNSPFCYYIIKSTKNDKECKELMFYVQINVKRLVIVYFLDSEDFPRDEIKKIFHDTILGSESFGYKIHYGESVKDGSKKSEIKFYLENIDENMLDNPSLQLFLINDLALLTRSIWGKIN